MVTLDLCHTVDSVLNAIAIISFRKDGGAWLVGVAHAVACRQWYCYTHINSLLGLVWHFWDRGALFFGFLCAPASLMWTAWSYSHCDWFAWKPHFFHDNLLRRIIFVMVALPTRAYVGRGDSPIEIYMRLGTGFKFVIGAKSGYSNISCSYKEWI